MLFRDLDKEIAEKLGLKKSDVRKILETAEDSLFHTLIKGITVKFPLIMHLRTELKPPKEYYNAHTRKRDVTGKRYVLKAFIMRKIKNEFKSKKVY